MLKESDSTKRLKESLEYRIAAGYTERQSRRRQRLRAGKLLLWATLISAPFGYAIAATALSNDLTTLWLQEWAGRTTALSDAWSSVSPGIRLAAETLYGDEPGARRLFIHFAMFDMGVVVLATAITVAAVLRLRVRPASDSLALAALERIARGFPNTSGFSVGAVGGKSGGLWFAVLFIILAPLALYFFYAEPLLGSGQFFIDAHAHCVEYDAPWWSRHRDCIRYADNDLAQTVWKLGWMSSLAVPLISFGIWLTAVMAIYPVWVRRQRRL